jgi:hypothetical protein
LVTFIYDKRYSILYSEKEKDSYKIMQSISSGGQGTDYVAGYPLCGVLPRNAPAKGPKPPGGYWNSLLFSSFLYVYTPRKAAGQQHLLFRDRTGGKETQWEGKDGTIRRSGKADERKSGRDTGSEEAMGVSTA